MQFRIYQNKYNGYDQMPLAIIFTETMTQSNVTIWKGFFDYTQVKLKITFWSLNHYNLSNVNPKIMEIIHFLTEYQIYKTHASLNE